MLVFIEVFTPLGAPKVKAHADKWHRAGGNWFKVLSICDEVRLGRGLRSVYTSGFMWIFVDLCLS